MTDTKERSKRSENNGKDDGMGNNLNTSLKERISQSICKVNVGQDDGGTNSKKDDLDYYPDEEYKDKFKSNGSIITDYTEEKNSDCEEKESDIDMEKTDEMSNRDMEDKSVTENMQYFERLSESKGYPTNIGIRSVCDKDYAE